MILPLHLDARIGRLEAGDGVLDVVVEGRREVERPEGDRGALLDVRDDGLGRIGREQRGRSGWQRPATGGRRRLAEQKPKPSGFEAEARPMRSWRAAVAADSRMRRATDDGVALQAPASSATTAVRATIRCFSFSVLLLPMTDWPGRPAMRGPHGSRTWPTSLHLWLVRGPGVVGGDRHRTPCTGIGTRAAARPRSRGRAAPSQAPMSRATDPAPDGSAARTLPRHG